MRKELQKVKEEIIEGEAGCVRLNRRLWGRKDQEPLALTPALFFLPAFVQELRKRGSP